jgi:hypothetical protein
MSEAGAKRPYMNIFQSCYLIFQDVLQTDRDNGPVLTKLVDTMIGLGQVLRALGYVQNAQLTFQEALVKTTTYNGNDITNDTKELLQIEIELTDLCLDDGFPKETTTKVNNDCFDIFQRNLILTATKDVVTSVAFFHVCLFVTMRPAGTRCICELYWHNITSFNNNSFHTIHAPVRFEPASTRDPTATHHLSLPGLRYKTLLTTCQTSSPVEV